MADKPKHASEYRSEQVELVRAMCLYDFSEPEAVGPMRVAAFIAGAKDDELQADVVGFIGQLLAKVNRPADERELSDLREIARASRILRPSASRGHSGSP